MSNASTFIKKESKISNLQQADQETSSVYNEKKALKKDRKMLAGVGYLIGRKIDCGTFATVRYAEKISVYRTMPLAVKIIDKAKASSLFTQKFLVRELDIWPRLHHPHIIKVENIFPIESRIYVFMEWACQGSVIEYVQTNGAVDENMAHKWCKGMCEALQYCHRKGIAHRDLKCDNLLLDLNLEIKIGDFGFCCKCTDKTTGCPIYSNTHCGSSSYVAPEVIAGKPYDPIPADIWSAGVCIYVILNNAMPFDDSNITRMHNDQLKRRWTFSPKVRKKLSPSAKKLITRMLEPVVSERPNVDQILVWLRLR